MPVATARKEGRPPGAVWSSVLRLYERDAALAWLLGVNPLLGDRRPIDLIRLGRAEELMRAIRAERSDSYA